MEEQSPRPRPIEPQATDTAAFVGLAQEGPTRPQRLASYSEFLSTYGEPVADSYLALAARSFFENGGRRLYIARVAPVGDLAGPDDYIGDRSAPPAERTGLAAIEDLDDAALLAVPDEVRRQPVDLTPVTAAVLDQCERRRDRLGVVSTLAGMSDPADLPPRRDSSFGAFYYPWIEVRAAGAGGAAAGTDDEPVLLPPSGAAAGVIARTELERGVHKAPGGRELRGALGLEFPVTEEMQSLLNPRGVNCLRHFRDRGLVVWGARTMSRDAEWKYVSVRRYFIYLERSIRAGIGWAVFEPNNAPLWARVRGAIETFLHDEWRRGASPSAKPEDAFFVKCDRSTMTQADIDAGRLIVQIGFAPLRPAEFVIIRIQQLAGQTRG